MMVKFQKRHEYMFKTVWNAYSKFLILVSSQLKIKMATILWFTDMGNKLVSRENFRKTQKIQYPSLLHRLQFYLKFESDGEQTKRKCYFDIMNVKSLMYKNPPKPTAESKEQ